MITPEQLEELKRAAMDISWAASRKDRASDLKRYLVADLEFIDSKIAIIIDILLGDEANDGRR